MKNLAIDRIENNIAICEDDDGKKVELNIKGIPKEAKEGDVLYLDDKSGAYRVDIKETKARKNRAFFLQEKLLKKERLDDD